MDILCPRCGESRRRGVTHRCPAPDLIPLSSAAEAVLAACVAAGGSPLIVGGAVRDAILNETAGSPRRPKDVDIEVYGISDRSRLLDELDAVGSVDERGVSFGVIAVRVDREDFDVSVPRRDSKTGSGHHGFDVVVDPDLDEVAAFARRDFTLNALGYDPTSQELVDPWGGATDLAAGLLRHTTEAYVEDPLRVLRAVQFASRMGFTVHPDTATLSASIADQYPSLSVERVWGEWRKIARGGTHISHALDVLRQVGWEHHFPELAATRGVPQDPVWHPEGDVHTHLGLAADQAAANAARDQLEPLEREVAVLGALVHDFGKVTSTQVTGPRITSHGHDDAGVAPAAAFLQRIGAPKHLIDRVTPLVAEHMCHAGVQGTPSKSAVRSLIRRLDAAGGGSTIEDWARVVDADCAGRGPGAKASPTVAWLERAVEPGTAPRKGLLTGAHLIARGFRPGPDFKPVLAAALTAQDDGMFEDEAGALAWLDNHLS